MIENYLFCPDNITVFQLFNDLSISQNIYKLEYDYNELVILNEM